ncbi:MAG: PRC-barrel domain-containing protein [Gemmatimonadaceae bacterium]
MARDNTPADRGLRDEANVGPDPNRPRNLIPMRELDDYEVADGEPDIRGWRVFTSSGRELGRIEDLLVDTASDEVVMLDVDLRRNDRHTLAPIRAAWIDREHERVIIDSRELEGADESVPTLARRGELTDEEVREFGDRYERAYGDRGYEADRDYHVHHLGDRLRFWRRRHDDAAALERRATEPAAAERTATADRAEVERAADRSADQADAAARARSEEARRVNETLGADAAARAGSQARSVERVRADEWRDAERREAQRREEERRLLAEREGAGRATDERATDERERRQHEVDELNAQRARDRQARQVRLPAADAPADTPADTPADASADAPPRGRVIEEVVVRRREVGPDEVQP